MEVAINTFCFVCNSKPKLFCRASSAHQTPSTKTSLYKLIGTLLVSIQSARCIDNAVDIICKRCVDRLHNYDRLFCDMQEACSELRDLLKLTEATFAIKQENPLGDPLDIEGAAATPPVDTIRRVAAAKANNAAAEVAEQKVASVDTWPPATEPIVEPLSVDEMLSASETANAGPAARVDDIEMSADTAESDWADDFEWKLHEEEAKPDPRPVKCYGGCDGTFTSRKMFLKHIQFFHRRTCAICDLNFPSTALYERHMQNHGVDGGTCMVCQFECNSVADLIAHMQKHSTAAANQCVVCDKKTSRLDVHMRRMHMMPTAMCEMCGKIFLSGGLSVHLQQHKIRSDVNYKCSMCPKVFKTRGRRTVHQITHKMVPRFQCSTCGAKFKRKFNLQLHEKRHVMDTKTVPCTMCEARFEHKFYLKQHMKNKHGMFDAGEKIERDGEGADDNDDGEGDANSGTDDE